MSKNLLRISFFLVSLLTLSACFTTPEENQQPKEDNVPVVQPTENDEPKEPEGAVISEFSTPSFDDSDIFTDPDIKRVGKFQ